MRNVCRTVSDFLENLRIELEAGMQFKVRVGSADTDEVKIGTICPIHRKSVFATQHNEPIGENKREAVKFNVLVQLSAVISTEEGDYLLECTENMGIDYHDGEPELKGTEKAQIALAQLKEFCEANNLTIRPGSLSI